MTKILEVADVIIDGGAATDYYPHIMKLRCPYCKAVFEPQKSVLCPSCGKAMKVGPGLRKSSEEKKKKKRYVAHQAHGSRRGFSMGPLSRNPKVLLGMMLVMGIVGVTLLNQSKKEFKLSQDEKLTMACRQLKYIGVALTNFNNHCSRYPTTEEGLDVLAENRNIQGWKGPYLLLAGNDPWTDPWGTPYHYSVHDGSNVVILTLGRDGIMGTDDDRTSPDFKTPPIDLVKEALSDWKNRLLPKTEKESVPTPPSDDEEAELMKDALEATEAE